MQHRRLRAILAASAGLMACVAAASARADDLLFRASADAGARAEVAGGDPVPNFQENISVIADGRSGGAIRQADDGAVSWKAAGNLYARAGTVGFNWRSRYPVDASPFVLFRASFAEHTSWDMTFLRIDWNGHGFDAFVTDQNLARVRVSFRIDQLPAPDAWHHIAFAWDERVGVRLYFDGREVARKDQVADLDSGLDQFGFAGRVISPHQVHSRYNFTRGSDLDELRVYGRMLAPADVASVAAGGTPAATDTPAAAASRIAWLHRFGWDGGAPPLLAGAVTTIRKVEFASAKDLKEENWKGVDGIAETTWPGVYNRSRLPGRSDYLPLPDWNVYVDGGKAYDLTIPDGERVNRIELRGAAYGTLAYSADGKAYRTLANRARGEVRSFDAVQPVTGGRLRFTNAAQETPIQELWAYNVSDAPVPTGTATLRYTVQPGDPREMQAVADLYERIAGRFVPEERAAVVAVPAGASVTGTAPLPAQAAPMVHVLVPARFDESRAERAPLRSWNYGWQNFNAGLDGIALDIPALNVAAGPDGLVPLNIRVHDPIWPGRDLIDVSVSVRPGEARTLFLDTRDRILTDDSLWITIASGAADFGPAALAGMGVRLVFKDRAAAKIEHVADRFTQVKDNWGYLVEAKPATTRAGLYRRLLGDISDLLRVDPDNVEARLYWQDIGYGTQDKPPFRQPVPPAGVPLWAFRQVEDLKLVGRFINWWIDNRQVDYGDFGGGISDDTDLIAQWPGVALMGVTPDKIRRSLNRLADAAWANGMHVNGLNAVASDELHAYEEGLNSDAAALYLNWGDPLRVERLMATSRALRERIILPNPFGHLHFASNWYGGNEVHRSGPWEWQKLYSFTVMHAPLLVGLYNANPIARGTVTGVIDGLLAHGKQQPDGSWRYPNEINWRSDAERVGDTGGMPTALQSAWASWRWTGDNKYLRPIAGRVAASGAGSIADLNDNVLDALSKRGSWGKALADKAAAGGAFEQYAAWATTGDKAWLEKLHGAAIQDKSQREYMQTEGHWWTDRVEQPSEILQRERLGGVALKRNWTWPGNTVSWRFAQDGGAEQVAILMPGATPSAFKVVGYNLSAEEQRAVMTGWNVTAGTWQMRVGIDSDGDDKADTPLTTATVKLERSLGVDVVFPARQTVVMDFALVTPTTPAEQRPDLGIGAGDVRVRGRAVTVTVHSLGHADAAGGTVRLVGGDGKVLAQGMVPALAAPADLQPRMAQVQLRLPAGAKGVAAEVALADGGAEVTLANNRVTLTENDR